MRVLHVTRDFPPASLGGLSTAVGGLVGALRRAGIEVLVVSFDAWRPRRSSSADRRPAANDAGDVIRIRHRDESAAASERARRFAPDLIHAHHGMLWDWVAALRRDLAVPAIKTVHVVQALANQYRGVTQATLSSQGQERALREADAVLVPSQAAAAALRRYHSPVAPKLRVVPHGIDDSAAARAAVAARARQGGTVVYAGRFDPMKGTDVLLEALPRVLAQAPAVSVGVAGGIPANRRGETRWLRQWQERLGAEAFERVELTGWLASAELTALYARAAVAVVPSRFETFGYSALEAMLHGVALAASDGGALPELIESGRTGLVSPAGDATALADNVLALLRQPQSAIELGERAAAEARRFHLWEDRLPATLALYEAVLRGP